MPDEPSDGHACEEPAAERARDLTFIKRVVGLPGEWLLFKDNRTYVGERRGGPFERAGESFTKTSPCGELCNLPKPIQVPDGDYYMAGDNRGASDDSRHWGPIPRAWVLAKVLHRAG